MKLYRFIILMCFLLFVLCGPLKLPNVISKYPQIPSTETFNFLKRYGYLEDGAGDTEALYTEETVIEAIKTVQKFGALPQTGVVDNATVKLMMSPRCGVPDLIRKHRRKRYVLGSDGWKKRHITYFLANWTPKLGEDVIAKNIQLALDTWGRYGRLTFSRINDPSADIIVAFARGPHGDNYPFDGPGNILGHAYFPYEHQGLGGDIHFDDDENWTVYTEDTQEGTDFFTVAIHELGHSLGLAHSPVPNSIMFPYYKGYSPEFVLDYDDILGMYELYIRGSSDVPPVNQPETTTEHASDDDFPYTTMRNRKNTEETTPAYRPPWEDPAEGNNEDIDGPYWDSKEITTTMRSGIDNSTVTYEGDNESVDDHKKHDRTHGIPSTNSPSLPDICEGYFDAVATIRDELFIFKDQYVWRLRDRNEMYPNYPVPIAQMFPKLPKTIKHIDAAYERPDGSIILFTDKNYWVYDGSHFIENSPQPLTNYGLPDALDKIDAVQRWGKNGKTYLYRRDRFWRYNEESKTMDIGYPRHMEKWRGVPQNLDAATTWKDGYTYFFKDKNVWKFDNDWIIVMDTSPLPAPQTWLGCPEKDYVSQYFL